MSMMTLITINNTDYSGFLYVAMHLLKIVTHDGMLLYLERFGV